ncbi:MAG: 1-deoxy-D-xylulose-5-phosphate synthase [Planctomycetaceae bacterium]|jgi:1-deoxy-D-xylulose-5-phosphate synthase|nr:1-deoxy-D-xylulose-5-phosphate synthase [Planctomycetaceae bacterium]
MPFEPILPSLQSPHDLKNLTPEQLRQLAAEIRNELCKISAARSVHFASNLGVVELTIALHSVFDFSYDRLIWDTGHQIYPHKLLTGRFARFSTIRTKGGLMGFPNPAESEYDLMMTGHAGSSVGTAFGLCCGDDLLFSLMSGTQNSADSRHSVAVIGDGAFASGGVFEAMNHAGELQKKFTVILNDNKMSICPRVGGLAHHLDGLRLHPKYSRFKQMLHNAVDRLPFVGKPLDNILRRFKDTLKAGLIGGRLFETLGFRYIGPIDGHDIARLQRFLRLVRKLDEPVLLHIFTEKGRGYKPAEDNPTEFHVSPGVIRVQPPAEAADGSDKTQKPTAGSGLLTMSRCSFTEHARNAVDALMQKNPKVCVITAAMCQGNRLEPIRDKYPDRFFDVGICESHAVVFAAGLAKSGLIPIVDIYSTFLQRAYDQIFQEVSLQNLPVIFAIDRAGLSGPDGPTHHGVFDLCYLRPFPNMVMMTPADAWETAAMFDFAAALNQPVAIRYPKAASGGVSGGHASPARIVLGKAETIRQGSDGFIAVCGSLLESAIQAAETLEQKGIRTGIINVRFVKPLDTATLLEPLRNGQFLMTVEEGMLAGGFGSAVLEAANEEHLDTRRVYRLGIPDRYVEHGERAELLADLGLTAENIVNVLLGTAAQTARQKR